MNIRLSAAFLSMAAASIGLAQPLTTTFTYQGELQTSGSPAAGLHDLRFRLFDAAAGGAQIGATLCSDNVAVADGRFTVSLDFGAQFAGQQRFLDIDVRADTGLNCTSAAGFVLLSPRQALTAAPNAAFALTAASATTAMSATTAATATTATNATQLNGQAAAFYQNATNLSAGTLSDLRLSANVALLNNAQTFTGAKTLSNAANLFTGTFTGPGAGLTGLNASNIASGTLADPRLSSNVALLNNAQTFSAAKTFSTAPLFTAAGSPFSVGSATLVTNLNADLLDGLNSTAFLQAVPVPLTLSGASVAHIIRGTNASTANGSSGVFGESMGIFGATSGVYGRSTSTAGTGMQGEATAATGFTYGVSGQSASTSGRGVYGEATAATGNTYGGRFESASTGGTAVFGNATATSGNTEGGRFSNASTSGRGVYGLASADTGTTYGGYFDSSSTSGRGVFGWARAAAGGTYGVHGRSDSNGGSGVFGEATSTGFSFNAGGRFESEGSGGGGVVGLANASTGSTFGGFFQSASTSGSGVYGGAIANSGTTYGGFFESNSTSGRGVYGQATDTGAGSTPYGVRGLCSTETLGFGVFALGDMGATGIKSFRIDHPTDPANKYLLHYSSESPFPQNFYNGNVTTDADGYAWVELPEYFAEINTNFKYQLTVVDDEDETGFVQAKISKKIQGNRFQIRTNAPNVEVSWRVDADRNDLRIKAKRPTDEREKTGLEKGKYQHPEYYNLPKEMGMDYSPERDSPAAADQPVSPK